MWGRKNQKAVVLDFYTARADVYNLFPVIEAKKTRPLWAKSLVAPFFNSPTDKGTSLQGCPAFLKYYAKGFVMPLWSDLFLEWGGKGQTDYRWQYADHKSVLEVHPNSDFGEGVDEKKAQHFKLVSPWLVVCSEDMEFLVSEPHWQFETMFNMRVMPGVLEFKTQCSSNVNIMVERQQNTASMVLKAGSPLLYIRPMTEKSVVLKTHLVSETELKRIQQLNARPFFTRNYFRKAKLISKNACPFTTKVPN